MGDLIASLQIDVVSSRSAVVRFDAATGALVSKALLDGSYEPPSGCANDGQGSDYPPGGNSGRWLDKVELASNEWYNDGGLEDDTINSTCFTQGRVWWIGLNAAHTATLVGLNPDKTVHASYLTSEGDLSFASGCTADVNGIVYWVDFSHPNTLRRFDTVGGTQLADVALTNPIGGTPNWVNLSVTSNGAHLLATWYDGSGNSYLVVWDSAGAVVWHSTLVGPSYQIYSACFSSDNAAVYLAHSTPAEPSFGRGFDHRPIASTGFGTDPDTFDWAFDPATNWAGTPLLVWLGSQADETGYCVSTVHDFGSSIDFPGGTSTPIIPSPAADFFYQVNSRGGTGVGSIVRTDAATWTVTDPWVTLTDPGHSLSFQALAEDPSGNLYTFCGTGAHATVPAIVTKVTPGGVQTSAWASWTVPDNTQNTGLAVGRDGFLYVLVSFATNTPAVYKIDLGTGAVTLVSSTIFADGAQVGVDNNGGSCFGATSAGVLWFTLDAPAVASPDYNVDTVVRSYDPAGPTTADHAAQSLVFASDGKTEAWGGGFVDSADHFVVAMVTFQGGSHLFAVTALTTVDGSHWSLSRNTWDPTPGSFGANAHGAAIAWNGSYFMAVANPAFSPATVIQTSPTADPGTWTAHASPFDATSPGHATCVAWSPTLDLWAVGGHNISPSASLATTPDAITWTTQIVAGDFEAICWAGTQFVAVGVPLSGQVIATSTDGATWVGRRALATSTPKCVAAQGSTVVVGNAYAAGSDSCILYSTDNGTTWAANTSLDSAGRRVVGLTYDTTRGRWLALVDIPSTDPLFTGGASPSAENGVIFYATNPAGTWTENPLALINEAAPKAIAYDPNLDLIVACIADAPFITLPGDFSSWAQPPTSVVSGDLVALCYAPTLTKLVAVGIGSSAFPDLSWFLRVAPDGTATRIASTWSYAGLPLPFTTPTNIADGPLGTSLCCELDDGAGISPDGKTLWFIDDGDQSSPGRDNAGNLLRKLTLCPAARTGLRWGIHMGAT